jgi:prephenate dehydrogenase
MKIARMSIIGVGLLGGSLGLAAKKAVKDCHIVGYGHRAITLGKAIEMLAIDEATQDLTQAVREADCVVLCTPVGLFDELLVQMAPALKPGAIVTDVGSTKRSVVSSARKLLPDTVRFVGSHPMAGSEKRGIEFARGDLFEGSVCITTPLPTAAVDAVETIEELWKSMGMRIIRMTPEEHDRRVALVSHLPHAVAAALVALQDEQTLALAGKGFADATRIAGGDGVLWRDIFLENADELRVGITRLREQLDHLESLLRPESAALLKDWLDQMAAKRQSMQ